jgi:hypothetical protein
MRFLATEFGFAALAVHSLRAISGISVVHGRVIANANATKPRIRADHVALWEAPRFASQHTGLQSANLVCKNLPT